MRWGIVTLGLILALSMSAMAQQQKPKQLTNEDFPSGQRVDSKVEAKDDKTADDSDDKDAKDAKGDKGDKDKTAKKGDKKGVGDKKGEGEKKGEDEKAEKAKKAQDDWQKKYGEAQQKASQLDRQKTQAELTARELRDKLRTGGVDPQQFDAISRQLREAESQLKDLNSQYDEAKKTADEAKTEGDGKGYKEEKKELPKTDKSGRPNPEYYSKNYNELNDRQKSAQEKVELYQSRINEARQRAYQGRSVDPSHVGSPYYTDPEVKKLMEESQQELQKAQEELEQTNQGLDQLRRDAKNSGVPLR